MRSWHVSAIGTDVTIDGRPFKIVGVAPQRFDGLNLGAAVEIWSPLEARDNEANRGNRGLSIGARLPEGAGTRQAQTQLDAIAARLASGYPESNRGTLKHPDDPRPMVVVPHTRLHPRIRSENCDDRRDIEAEGLPRAEWVFMRRSGIVRGSWLSARCL